jgi:RNA polymerase sigma-70 factor (ECF subfamily)
MSGQSKGSRPSCILRMRMPGSSLSDAFVQARAAAGHPWPGDAAELEAMLADHLHAARAAWPDVELEAMRFVAHLAEVLPATAGAAELRGVRATDVYLARACADGDAGAIVHFEERYFGEIDAAGRRLRCPAAIVADVKQILRRILFVAEATRPAAAGRFAGRGDLRGWVRVAAVRELQRILIKEQRNRPFEEGRFVDVLAPAADPELGHIRARYQRELGEAVTAALAATPSRERALFRFQVLEGLGSEEIAELYGVHRATASRWLLRAREGVLERTREELARRLGIDTTEAASIIRLMHSRLEVSLGRVFLD